MPIYEYECRDCGQTKEVLQRFDEQAPGCERCNQTMQRILSTTGGIVIKEARTPAPAGTCCGSAQGCDNPKGCCGG